MPRLEKLQEDYLKTIDDVNLRTKRVLKSFYDQGVVKDINVIKKAMRTDPMTLIEHPKIRDDFPSLRKYIDDKLEEQFQHKEFGKLFGNLGLVFHTTVIYDANDFPIGKVVVKGNDIQILPVGDNER